jgi:predicted regulator of Ras-like GTPase activity (Roadblock/LC7/MglB family)
MADQPKTQENKKFRSGLILSRDQYNTVEKKLHTLLDMIPARFVLLVDTSGQLVSILGEHTGVEPSILGSLIAADLAASQEIARITGSFQEFQMILREGEKNHIAICEAGKEMLFLVLFGKDVPLGWARKLIQRSAQEIGAISAIQPEIPEMTEKDSKGDLPDLFNSALDEIWKD